MYSETNFGEYQVSWTGNSWHFRAKDVEIELTDHYECDSSEDGVQAAIRHYEDMMHENLIEVKP